MISTGQTISGDSMRKVALLVILLLLFRVYCQASPLVYELVRSDGYVIARTEVNPSVGDTYWDASSDVWYTVIEVRGNQALAGTEAEASLYFRTRNLRWGLSIVLLLAAAVYVRRRLKSPSGTRGK